jgi:hypothetical protein
VTSGTVARQHNAADFDGSANLNTDTVKQQHGAASFMTAEIPELKSNSPSFRSTQFEASLALLIN